MKENLWGKGVSVKGITKSKREGMERPMPGRVKYRILINMPVGAKPRKG